MNKITFISIALSFTFSQCASQVSVKELMKDAELKLKNNMSGTSQILTDKKYDVLHPVTEFRDLIKKYCTSGSISITSDTIPGKKIRVFGRIVDGEGKPVKDALVYLYHTDSRGWYAANSPHVNMNEGDMRHARLFGYIKTGMDGMFELQTIKPAGYPQSDLPAHIHVHIWADGYRNYVNEFLFDDDERLVGKIRNDAMRNKFIISKPEKASSPFVQQFNYTIILQRQ